MSITVFCLHQCCLILAVIIHTRKITFYVDKILNKSLQTRVFSARVLPPIFIHRLYNLLHIEILTCMWVYARISAYKHMFNLNYLFPELNLLHKFLFILICYKLKGQQVFQSLYTWIYAFDLSSESYLNDWNLQNIKACQCLIKRI